MPVVLRIQKKSECVAAVLEIFRISGMLTSNLHILALAINQFIGIVHPLKYKMVVTTKRIRMLILLLWLIPIGFVGTWFVSIPHDGFRHPRCSHRFYSRFPFRLSVFTAFIIPLLSTFALYALILFSLLKAKAKYSSNLRLSSRSSYRRRVKSKLKLVWTTLLILSTFTLSWGVCVLYFLLVCIEGCTFIYLKSVSFHAGFLMNSTVNFLVTVKLLLNPLIYALRMHHIRNCVLELLNAACLHHFPNRILLHNSSLPQNQTADTEFISRRYSGGQNSVQTSTAFVSEHNGHSYSNNLSMEQRTFGMSHSSSLNHNKFREVGGINGNGMNFSNKRRTKNNLARLSAPMEFCNTTDKNGNVSTSTESEDVGNKRKKKARKSFNEKNNKRKSPDSSEVESI